MCEKDFKDIQARYLANESLKTYTGFGTGGKAKAVIVTENKTAFIQTIKLLREQNQKFKILGNGSNVLALDEGYDGHVVITKGGLERIEFSEQSVTSEAGMPLNRLCVLAMEKNLSGLEFAFGIPGTVGGAVYMNAGAYGGEMCDVIVSVEVLTGDNEIKHVAKDELNLSYRHSVFHERSDLIILSATFSLEKSDKKDIKAKMDDLMGRRVQKQPLEYKSCGSTFKRPNGAYASKLVEDCGLKGRRVGDAEVSTKHSGFIVNKGDTTTRDILELIEIVKQDVLNKTGFSLECEVEILR